MSRTFESPLFTVTIRDGGADVVLKPVMSGPLGASVSADVLHQAATAFLNAACAMDQGRTVMYPRVALLLADVDHVPSEVLLKAEIVIDRLGNVIKNRYGKTHEPAHAAKNVYHRGVEGQDPVECREFYELMQEYRHVPRSDFGAVVASYDAVKAWIAAWGERRARDAAAHDEATYKRLSEVEQFYDACLKALQTLRTRLAEALGVPPLATEGATDAALRRVAELAADDRARTKFKETILEILREPGLDKLAGAVRELYTTVSEAGKLVTRVRLCGQPITTTHGEGITCGLPTGHPGPCSPRRP